MSEIKIFGKNLAKEEVESLKALAAEAGLDPQKIVLVDSIDEPAPECEDEIFLILANQATCSQPDLEKEMAKIMNGPRRAIWIWPKDAPAADLPEAIQKYAYSIIPWDAEKLSAVVADDDIVCFEFPTGQPIPEVKTERNLCVEEIPIPRS